MSEYFDSEWKWIESLTLENGVSYVYQGALGSLLYAAHSESKLMIIKELSENSYFMYEFSFDEDYAFRILNDCEFTVSEKSAI